MSDLRSEIQTALIAFKQKPLRDAALAFFKTLGYSSERTVIVPRSDPRAFLDLFAKSAPFDQEKALFSDWLAADLLFQLTDQELSREVALFPDHNYAPGQLHSYIFFAVELRGRDYPRGKLANLARQLNRLFPTPVMVLIKHRDLVSLAVINRRPNKLDAQKDVLGRVTLIRDIVLAAPHRGHLDILLSLAISQLVHPQKKPITDFDALHTAWEQILNIELLNVRFYRELANWYFWALPQVEFPADLEPDDEKRRATGLIRLLTRLIFCWFLKEKNLVPEKLFHPADLAKILKGFDPESETSSTYYHAILQNLFFATLNQRMGKDSKGQPYRAFAKDEGFLRNKTTYDVNNLYRYEAFFREDTEAALAHFADIPFLNGGLFECLDRTEDGTDKKRYLDGFSRNPKKRPHVPDRLFFDSGETADLSTAYGDKKRKAERVTGLITILNRYKFTIVENTPIDQEIALDPELLGKVFENLLASYNEETKTTARKQTGSFYTPRPIVDYMVDESLKTHLARALVEQAHIKDSDARAGLDILFAYTEREHAFTFAEVAIVIAAIDAIKILDPACGSGAFPMGVLHKLVYILGKLDPDNERWKQTQLAKLDSAPMREELERAFAENNDDYGRKLYLIENCLYGVDIQPIAIQITKLRFFISLVCDQKTHRNKKDNRGIRPLPNLETKFVAANTLIGLPEMTQSLLVDPRVAEIEKEIEALYHNHFSEQRRDRKLSNQRKVKELRHELGKLLSESLMAPAKAKHIAEWDAFNPQSSADFFDPHWMFGRSLNEGFDVVIGNPPYIDIKALPPKAVHSYFQLFTTARNRINLYALFIEKGYTLISKNGILSLIIPNSLLVGESYTKLRQLILPDLTAVVKLPDGVFENATVETMLLFVERNSTRTTVAAAIYGNSEQIDFMNVRYNSFLKKGWLANQESRFSIFATAADDRICAKMEEAKVVFEDIAEFCLGLTPYDKYKGHSQELIESRHFHSDRKLNTDYVPLISGANITPYAISDAVSEWLNYGPWLGAPRDRRFFTEERIIVRQIASGRPPRIFAGYTTKALYHSQIGFAILAKRKAEVSLKVLLALLNSKLLNYYHERRFLDREKITFQKVLIANVRKFPLPVPSPKASTEISHLIDEILHLREMDFSSDTRTLEHEIDQQIYTLYGLTPEDIAFVEGTAK